jgi:hypothetical protein
LISMEQPTHSPSHPPLARDTFKRFIGPLILLALTLVVFGDVLLHPADRVIGSPSGDVASHSLWWHDLGWRELARGHLTLWNPYVYGGAPFHAGFAAALLYPPLWIGLVLPVHVALNWHFASHVFLAGLFTYIYCRRSRGLSYAASTLGGAMFMFSGAFFLHTYPGHPTAIAAMTWLPLIVLGFDRFVVSRRWPWLVLAAAAAAMQIYGGQVQYFYYTAIAMGMYAVLYAIAATLGKVSVSRGSWRDILMPLLGYGAIYVSSVLLSAPQLFPAFEAKVESVRGGRAVYRSSSGDVLAAPGEPGDVVCAVDFHRWINLLRPDLFLGGVHLRRRDGDRLGSVRAARPRRPAGLRDDDRRP